MTDVIDRPDSHGGAGALHEAVADLQMKLGGDVVHLAHEADFGRHRQDFVVSMRSGFDLVGVAYPRTTEQVSQVLAACHAANVVAVPQGGMTGMAGGGVATGPALILSVERMRQIEELDQDSATITVQAGVVLEAVQKAADSADLFFPLDLGGRGTATIGGNASTNAGGNRVLRYGMMRDLVLGVEAVLADGTIISSLNKMLKNNAGYDIKQLFLGSEGTLGVISRLVLKLFPKPLSVQTALVALADYDAVLDLLRRAKSGFGGSLSAYEVMWPEFYDLGTTALGKTPPIAAEHGVYVLIETSGTDPDADQARFEQVIGEALEAGTAADAVVAQSSKDAEALWAVRDCPGEFPKTHWPQLGFDVSIPTGQIGAAKIALERKLRERWPRAKAVFFGHVADSNLHVSVRLDDATWEHDMEEAVYSTIGDWKGSISAEHGIGSLKREFLHYSRSPAELALMRTLKDALDPKGILNPGKVI